MLPDREVRHLTLKGITCLENEKHRIKDSGSVLVEVQIVNSTRASRQFYIVYYERNRKEIGCDDNHTCHRENRNMTQISNHRLGCQ